MEPRAGTGSRCEAPSKVHYVLQLQIRAYGTRKFNVSFTNALKLSWFESIKFLNIMIK
jgi:hypothetical protein